jgi:hypothetical protein
MSLKEINKYRLTSMEEPTDEMLAVIMREAAEEASRRGKEAKQRYSRELNQAIQESKLLWQTRINTIRQNG